MSMKNTIARGDTYHLYEERLDNTSIYLEFEEVELDLAIRRSGRSVVKVSIPIQEWRQIIAGWQLSDWASDKRRDYGPISINKEQFDKFVTKFREKHPDVFEHEKDAPAE
ncbi:MAG: hypothetical protein CBB97_07205 [Candidatus Endolissoclinum sp. TMED37]|nr:MAG: hypothetical protein CBB97_07205 [Candidatus Endolissoclinum sp. TMED37]